MLPDNASFVNWNEDTSTMQHEACEKCNHYHQHKDTHKTGD